MITKKQAISCISKALKVPSNKVNINLSDKDFENWENRRLYTKGSFSEFMKYFAFK